MIGTFIQELDWAILNTIRQDMTCPALDVLMPLVSALANAGLIFFAAAGIMLFFRSKRICAVNILIFLALGAVLANLIIKPLVARDRPCWIMEDIPLLIAVPHDFSFPSGHTLHSVGVALVIFLYDKRIGIPSLILAALIAFSRLYLFVHFPSDVLGGALIGAALAVGTYYLTKLMLKKIPKLAEKLT